MAAPQIPGSDAKRTIIYKDGDTEDIIRVIMIGDKRFEKYGKDFCKWVNHHFKPDEQSLEKLWRMVRYDYEYQTDREGIQDIKTPPALHKIGKGDCKSKTLFVNAALRCLGIEYKIRFTAYGMDNTVKHVYTVANLNGKKIVIDTVYHYFNKEAMYSFKKDYDMTEIAIVEGLPEEKDMLPIIREKAYCAPLLSPEQEIYFQAKEKALEKWREIQQKKKEVKAFEPVAYNQLTSGVAGLKLIERELEIIKVMKPELANLCVQGIGMIQKATEKGDFCITGSVDPFLYRYAQKIKEASLLVAPANSYGLATKFMNEAARAGTQKSVSIGSSTTFPSRQCLGPLFLVESSPFSYLAPTPQNQYGFCNGVSPLNIFLMGPSGFATLYGANGPLGTWQNYINKIYYAYGSATTSRVKIGQFGNQAKNIIDGLVGTKLHAPMAQDGNSSYWFNTKADYDYVIEALNHASGVTGNWLDQTFETNPNADGTLGSGMFYSFADKISTTAISGFVPVNDLPTQVQIKKSLQDGFLNSCVGFSGVSFANVQQLARNGVLYDSGGEQPEYTLGKIYRLSKSSSVSGGIGDFGISAAIIAAIAAALCTIIAAIGDAVAKANASKSAAENIDNSLAASSQFRPPALNQGPNENDWPLQQYGGGGGNNGSSSSNMLPLAGAAVLAFLAMNEK